MSSILNRSLDRFREPYDIDGITISEPGDDGPEYRKDDMFPQDESSKATTYLAGKIHKMRESAADQLGREVRRADLSLAIGAMGIFEWTASVVWGQIGSFKAECGTAANLDNAIAGVLAKLPAPVDLAAILGYDEVTDFKHAAE